MHLFDVFSYIPTTAAPVGTARPLTLIRLEVIVYILVVLKACLQSEPFATFRPLTDIGLITAM